MNDAKVSRVLDSWMATVNPECHTGESSIYTPEAQENFALLSSAAAALNTPANMQVTGDQDVATQQLNLFQTQQATGATSDESVQQMFENPATGLMHVSDLARIANNWNPVLLDNSAANSIAYQNYVTQLVRFPLVTLNYAQRQTLNRETSDWNTLIDSIADTFTGIAQEDKDAIVSGLKNLAQAASSTMSVEQKTSLFCQNAINAANNVYEFYLYNSTCSFKEESGKGYDTKQNQFDVLQVKLTLVMPLWTKENVQKIIGQTSSSLDDWLNNNSSSTEGTSPIPALQN